MHELENETLRISLPREDAVHPKILRADRGGEVLPSWLLGIGGRPGGIRTHVTEATGHPDPIRANQFLRRIVARIGIKPDRIPRLLCSSIEIRIGKHSQSHNAACIAVERAYGD